jgi:Bacterial regulatory helix-turn-helix protein, lysR family
MKQNFTVRQRALDGVEAFLSVAKHRNFRKAAAELGVTPWAISQAVRALESRVGAALFIRTTRSVGLSEAGERFFAHAKPAFEELVSAGEAAREIGQRPAGLPSNPSAARSTVRCDCGWDYFYRGALSRGTVIGGNGLWRASRHRAAFPGLSIR